MRIRRETGRNVIRTCRVHIPHVQNEMDGGLQKRGLCLRIKHRPNTSHPPAKKINKNEMKEIK